MPIGIIIGIISLIILYFLYIMFIEGWLFKLILLIGGWFGIYIFLLSYVKGSNHIVFTISNGYSMSWAAVIPTVICLLCLLSTRSSND